MSDLPTTQRTTRRLWAIVVAIGIILTACSTTAPKQTKFMQQHGIDVSAEELRIQVRSFAAPFSGIMEQAADRFVENNPDPEEIRLGLLWKTNGIPAIQRSLFVQDPLAALFDTWVLLAQMRNYFETGPGSEPGRRGREFALDAIDRMEGQIEILVRSISATDDIEAPRELVYQAAAKSEVDTTFATRPSTDAQLAKFTAEARPGIGTAVGTLTTSLGDVWTRLDVYSAYLPKQARWQAELMVLDVAGGRDPGATLDYLENITDSLDRVAETVGQVPDLVTGERDAVLYALQQERIIVLETFQEELVRTYEFISRERTAAFTEGLATERIAAIEALTKERIATLQAIHEERVATMEELDTIVGGLSEDAMTRLVDRIFVRLLVLIVIVGAVAAVVGFLIVRGSRKRQ